MTLYRIKNEVKCIRKKLENKLEHHFLKQFVNQPFIDDDKIAILSFLLKDYTTYEKENYIITVMLVQIALNTHDNVTDGPEFEDHLPERKSKQLTVLAGDYYSGLYYLTLSELDNVKMTNKLATAIKLINERKMNLYYHEYDSIDEWFELIKDINSLLIVHIANYIEANQLEVILQNWLLVKQISLYLDGEFSHLITKWTHPELSKHDFFIYLEKESIKLITTILSLIDSLPEYYADLKLYLLNNINAIQKDHLFIFKTEEG